MKNSLLRRLFALVALSLAAFLPALAQDGDDTAGGFDDDRWVHFYAEASLWAPQPVGLDFFPATRQDPNDLFGTELLSHGFGTEADLRWRGGIEFKNDIGGLMLTWFATRHESRMTELRPSQFVFGEQLAHPFLAGFRNDGLADGFDSLASGVLREMRLDFYRTAFRGPRMSAKWFAGYRRTSFVRQHEATYFTIVDDLPALVPPIPGLEPADDTASSRTRYEGRGIEAGMTFEAPLWKDKIVLEADFAGAVMRGKTDSMYRSLNAAYVQGNTILSPQNYQTVFENSPTTVSQSLFVFAVNSDSVSTAGEVLEASLGLRWHAWRGMQFFAGFRSVYYSNLGAELRPADEGLLNPQRVESVEHSATYEGFYGGMAWSF